MKARTLHELLVKKEKRDHTVPITTNTTLQFNLILRQWTQSFVSNQETKIFNSKQLFKLQNNFIAKIIWKTKIKSREWISYKLYVWSPNNKYHRIEFIRFDFKKVVEICLYAFLCCSEMCIYKPKENWKEFHIMHLNFYDLFLVQWNK